MVSVVPLFKLSKSHGSILWTKFALTGNLVKDFGTQVLPGSFIQNINTSHHFWIILHTCKLQKTGICANDSYLQKCKLHWTGEIMGYYFVTDYTPSLHLFKNSFQTSLLPIDASPPWISPWSHCTSYQFPH